MKGKKKRLMMMFLSQVVQFAEVGSAASEGDMQVHPYDGADASQWKACVFNHPKAFSLFVFSMFVPPLLF